MSLKKINILSINTTGLAFGGDETRLLNQCSLLNKDIFNCTVCAPKEARGVMLTHFERAQARVIYITTLPFDLKKLPFFLAYLLRRLNFFIYCLKVIRIIYKENIDIIDGRLRAGGIIGILIKKITNIPVVVTLYETDEPKTLYKKASRFLLRYSNAIICDSIVKTDELRNWVGSTKPNYLVIPSAVQLKFSTDGHLEQIIKENKAQNKIIIGQVSSIIPRKGQDLLIKAFSTISKKYPKSELWIVGYIRDECFYNSLITLVKDFDLESKVQFIHYPEYIGNIFKALDVQVHPTRKDSLPNCILEGMSMGTPLISSSIGGIPEMVTHRETGLLFSSENQEELIKCIDEMLADQNFRQRLGAAAEKRFDEHFSPISLAKQLEDIFLKISDK